jgi:AcrR family transcriptional regulator
MARPKSQDKRNAIVEAAIRVIAAQGLGAPTMKIAEEAGVANGSLFTYFDTKTDLFNQLYLELKAEMASAALQGLPAGADLRKQMFHVWSNWMEWAVSNPEKRRALAQLGVSDEIAPAIRAAGHETMIGLAELMQRLRANGPMQKAPMAFVAAIMNSLAETTMDFMIHDPANARRHSKAGFDALWRAVA